MLRNKRPDLEKTYISQSGIITSESWFFFFATPAKLICLSERVFSSSYSRTIVKGKWSLKGVYAYFTLSALIVVIAQQEVHGASLHCLGPKVIIYAQLDYV